jgi:hypothetical protein
MASKSANSTIWTVALVGAGLIGFWFVGLPLLKKLAGGSSSTTGAGAVPNGGADDDPYYNADYPQQPTTDPTSGILNSILGLLGSLGGGKSSGGLSSGAGGGGLPGSGLGPGSVADSGDGPNADFFNSLLEGIYTNPDGSQGIMGAESNPDFGGASLFSPGAVQDGYDNTNSNAFDPGVNQIASQDDNEQLTNIPTTDVGAPTDPTVASGGGYDDPSGDNGGGQGGIYSDPGGGSGDYGDDEG